MRPAARGPGGDAAPRTSSGSPSGMPRCAPPAPRPSARSSMPPACGRFPPICRPAWMARIPRAGLAAACLPIVPAPRALPLRRRCGRRHRRGPPDRPRPARPSLGGGAGARRGRRDGRPRPARPAQVPGRGRAAPKRPSRRRPLKVRVPHRARAATLAVFAPAPLPFGSRRTAARLRRLVHCLRGTWMPAPRSTRPSCGPHWLPTLCYLQLGLGHGAAHLCKLPV